MLQSNLDVQAVDSSDLGRIPCKTNSWDHRSGRGCWQRASYGGQGWSHFTCSTTA